MRRLNVLRTGRAVIIVLFAAFVLCGILYPRVSSKARPSAPGPDATPKPKVPAKTPARTTPAKFKDFAHNGKQHSKLACNACHKFPSANWKQVRKADAFPDITDYPKHESCLKCHQQQFFGTPKPSICSICHTNPGPRNSTRFPFANPREVFDQTAKGKQAVSDFAVSFPHDRHIEIVSGHETPMTGLKNAAFVRSPKLPAETSCAVCHQTSQPQGKSEDEFVTKPPEKLGDGFWLKKGAFKTSPISHATCFTCHSPDNGLEPAQENCAACHKLAEKMPATDFDAGFAATIGDLDKITLDAWRKRDSSATFRHEFSSHADLECAACHNAAAMDTTSFQSRKVAVTACNMCHITATSDDGGVLNFEVDSRKKDASFRCIKCHITFGRMPIPESHLKAIVAAGQ